MKNSLKNKLKNQYENHAEIPSENLWERIESKLENSEEKKIVSFKKINYWKYAAIFLMLVSLGFVLNYFFNQKPVSAEIANSKVIILKEDNKSIELQESQNLQPNETHPIQEIAVSRTSNSPLTVSEKTIRKVEDEKVLIPINPNSVIKNYAAENQKEDAPKVVIPNIESKPVLAQQQLMVKEKTKYITANELLFGREVDKSYKEQQENDEGKMGVNLKKPKEVKILGITVYSDEP